MNHSTTRIDPRKPGDIDRSFGVEGFVEGPLGNSVRALANDRGGFVSAEWAGDDIVLRRLHANGSVDTAFGQNGIVQWNFENGQRAAPEQLISQPDGKFLLLGRTISNSDPMVWRAAVSRFHPNGSPDLVFGTRIIPYPYDPDQVWFVSHLPLAKLQADGKLLVTSGYSALDKHGGGIFEAGRIYRLDSNGAPDLAFGIQGQIEIRIKGQDTKIDSIDLLSDESGEAIVVSATIDRVRETTSHPRAALACFKATGMLNQDFASDGYWEAEHLSFFSTMTIDNDRILCAGTAQIPEHGQALWITRLTAQGQADIAFNKGEYLIIRLPVMPIYPTTLMPSDARTIVLMTGTSGDEWVYLLGIREDGSLDPDFADSGISSIGVGQVWAGAIQSDNEGFVVAADLGPYGRKRIPNIIGVLNR